MSKIEIETKVRFAVARDGELEERLERGLETIAAEFEARTCTFHEARPTDRVLRLRAQLGLPEHLVAITETIPYGKGMAGICAERREPVRTCDLQHDSSGVVQPRAKETGVAGALVVPVFREGELAATLGVGKDGDYDYSTEEEEILVSCGRVLLELLYQQ